MPAARCRRRSRSPALCHWPADPRLLVRDRGGARYPCPVRPAGGAAAAAAGGVERPAVPPVAAPEHGLLLERITGDAGGRRCCPISLRAAGKPGWVFGA